MMSDCSDKARRPRAGITCVTYNLRCCLSAGARGDVSEVVALLRSAAPDVLALQEVDRRRLRTGSRDQASEIGAALGLEVHYQPAFETGGGEYGIALLVPRGSRRRRSGLLPRAGAGWRSEPRAAIWVTAATDPPLQAIATHLGVHRRDRHRQLQALTGPEWLGHPDCHRPRVLLGDFNLLPWSAGYRQLRDRSGLADLACGPTFPARCPVLRLDYLFASPDLVPRRLTVLGGPMARRASDHRPLLCELELREETP